MVCKNTLFIAQFSSVRGDIAPRAQTRPPKRRRSGDGPSLSYNFDRQMVRFDMGLYRTSEGRSAWDVSKKEMAATKLNRGAYFAA